MLRIHGVPFSAHTRKVIVTALEKGLEYELVPAFPSKPPGGWSELSPLGLIPAIEDGGVRLADSSVIGLYLEKRYPERPFYPADSASFGRALWIEEFVDGGLSPHVLRGLLMQRVFAPLFLHQPPDEALIQRSLTEMIPPKLDYLEGALTQTWFAGDEFTIADVAVVSILANFHYAGERLDAVRYPRLREFLQRAARRDSFRRALVAELPAARAIEGLDVSLLEYLDDAGARTH
jgi:glutathione S-transferase